MQWELADSGFPCRLIPQATLWGTPRVGICGSSLQRNLALSGLGAQSWGLLVWLLNKVGRKSLSVYHVL